MKTKNQTRYIYPGKQIRVDFLRFCVVVAAIAVLFLSVTSLPSEAASGILDAAFGTGGKVTTNFGGEEIARAVALQPDGKIVTAGFVRILGTGFNENFALARYNSNGSLDTSFDGDGKVTTDFLGFPDRAEAIAIQPDGKIVVAGQAANTPPGGTALFALARYNSDGSLDTSFDGDGKLTTSFINGFESAFDLAVQPDGKLIVVGRASNQSSGGAALARYNGNGSLDTSFGTDGKIIASLGGGGGSAEAVALQSDGKIVIGGYARGVGRFDEDFMVARLNSNGQFDTTFGTNGVTLTDMSNGDDDAALDIALQVDSKVVAVGYAVQQTGDFAITRYNANGTLDTNFGNGGKVITEFGNEFSTANGVVIQADGKIVTAGQASVSGSVSVSFDFALTRHNTNGSIDTNFGNGGKVTTDFNNNYDQAHAVTLQPNGKIIAVGYTVSFGTVSSVYDFALARYLATSNTPFDFDGDGKADVSVFRPDNGVWYLLNSQSGFTAAQCGLSTDKIVPADYDGDGKTDIAVYRDGIWYLQRSSLGFIGVAFGESTDIPQPADFDGDGKADLAVFRPSNGTWYVLNLVNNQFNAFQFGQSGDKPVVGDYDGDGKADYAVVRGGIWYLQRSALGFTGVQFGESTDKFIPADYDGDGKADVAVFRPSNGTWYLLRSSLGFTGFQFGISTDLPVPADYDGDGKTDIAVFRNGIWYLQRSSQGFTGVGFGASDDRPIPAAFVR
ncbi:MAG: FG-GAP-like repeat-containing protein [Pyrinomonadaceae bacterium]